MNSISRPLPVRNWIAVFIVVMTPSVALSDVDPINLYGDVINFDVLREGKVIGQHETRFSWKNNELFVRSRMFLEISVLIFPVYAFDYKSTEIWKNDRLEGLKVRVVDGDEKTEVIATLTARGNMLNISGPHGPATVENSILSTNHWNAAVVHDNKVLNTLTGKVNHVVIEPGGVQLLSLPHGTVQTVRYDYTGDLSGTSVWYDSDGRWVKLQFKARDGSTIDYRCTSCGAGG